MKRYFNPLRLHFFVNNKPLENKAYKRASKKILLSLPLDSRKEIRFGKEELMIGDIFESDNEYYLISLKEVPYNEVTAKNQYVYTFYGLAAIHLNKEYYDEVVDYILENQRDINKMKHTKYNFIGNIFIGRMKSILDEIGDKNLVEQLAKIKVSMETHMNNIFILYNDKDEDNKKKIGRNFNELSIEDFIDIQEKVMKSHFDLYLYYRKGLSLYSNTYVSNEGQTYFTGINEYGQIIIFTNQDMEYYLLRDINDEQAVINWYDLSDETNIKEFEKELLLYVSGL